MFSFLRHWKEDFTNFRKIRMRFARTFFVDKRNSADFQNGQIWRILSSFGILQTLFGKRGVSACVPKSFHLFLIFISRIARLSLDKFYHAYRLSLSATFKPFLSVTFIPSFLPLFSFLFLFARVGDVLEEEPPQQLSKTYPSLLPPPPPFFFFLFLFVYPLLFLFRVPSSLSRAYTVTYFLLPRPSLFFSFFLSFFSHHLSFSLFFFLYL